MKILRPLLLGEGGPGEARAGCGGDPGKLRLSPDECSPAGRLPSPTGKVDRAQPGPDEGKQPKIEKQATLNGSVFHSMWPVSLFGCGPSSVTPYGVPPSPWGKATSRRGLHSSGLILCFRGPLHTRRCGGTLSKQERAGTSCGGRGAVPGRILYRPTPVTPTACHPLPGEGRGVRTFLGLWDGKDRIKNLSV